MHSIFCLHLISHLPPPALLYEGDIGSGLYAPGLHGDIVPPLLGMLQFNPALLLTTELGVLSLGGRIGSMPGAANASSSAAFVSNEPPGNSWSKSWELLLVCWCPAAAAAR
jgi:hypothetical protein